MSALQAQTLFVFIINDYKGTKDFLKSCHADAKLVEDFLDKKIIDPLHCVLFHNQKYTDIKQKCDTLLIEWKRKGLGKPDRVVMHVSGHGFERPGGYVSGINDIDLKEHLYLTKFAKLFSKDLILFLFVNACRAGTLEAPENNEKFENRFYAILHTTSRFDVATSYVTGTEMSSTIINQMKEFHSSGKNLETLRTANICSMMIAVMKRLRSDELSVLNNKPKFYASEDFYNLREAQDVIALSDQDKQSIRATIRYNASDFNKNLQYSLEVERKREEKKRHERKEEEKKKEEDLQLKIEILMLQLTIFEKYHNHYLDHRISPVEFLEKSAKKLQEIKALEKEFLSLL